MSSEKFNTNQEFIWNRQLYKEFEEIVFRYNIKLRQPVIELMDSQTHWGQWHPELSCIRISKHLIKKYSWDTVVNILKHEIAHQIVTQLFNSIESHGSPLFDKACNMIALPQEYRGAATDLNNPIVNWKDRINSADSEELQLQRRIEKLLALSESTNEHEAYLAMEKVQQIYSKYNIERMQKNKEQNFVYLIIETNHKKIDRVKKLICSILCNHFFVQIIYSEQFNQKTLDSYKTIEILGTQQNVMIAEYVYYFLLQQSKHLWLLYQKNNGKNSKHKNAFQCGLMIGFRNKLEISHKQQYQSVEVFKNTTKETDIVSLSHKELQKFVKMRFPKLTSQSSGKLAFDKETFDNGKSEGEKLTLKNALNKNQPKSTELRLLGSSS